MLYDGVTYKSYVGPRWSTGTPKCRMSILRHRTTSHDHCMASYVVVGIGYDGAPMSPFDDARDHTTTHDHPTIVVHDRTISYDGRTMKICDRTLSYDKSMHRL